MGGSPVHPEATWTASGRWIDHADYDHLIDKLMVHPDPEVVYVSGMISWHNQLYLGRCVRHDAGVPDHTGNNGMYGFRFLDESGRSLSEVGLPVAWNHAEFRRALPVTFFGVTLEFRPSAVRLEIWNRGTGTRLGAIHLDPSVPDVYVDAPETREKSSLSMRWTASDREGSQLSYAVLISRDGMDWWPAAYGLTTPEFLLDTSELAPGEYRMEVLALNSIRMGRSNPITFRVP
jgi:hypothetical protein